VHGAAQHAAAISASTATLKFPGKVDIEEGPASQVVPGTITFHPAHVTVGSHLTVHYTGLVAPTVKYTISLSAKVASIDSSHPPELIVTLTGGRGSFVAADNEPGHHQRGTATLSNLALFLNADGSLAALTGDFVVTHAANGSPPGEHGTFGLTPA